MAPRPDLCADRYTSLSLSRLAAVRVKCSPDDTVGDLKKLIAAQTGTNHSKIQLKKWCAYSHACLSFSMSSYPAPIAQTEPLPSVRLPRADLCSHVQVHDLQGPHHARGLRDPRWDESRDVLAHIPATRRDVTWFVLLIAAGISSWFAPS